MRIVHLVDYLMPTMGYQEFLLPKWNAKHGHQVHVVTGDRYTPLPDYERTWGRFLGPRVCGASTSEIEGVTIHRLPVTLEWRSRPWISGLGESIRRIAPDVVFCHGTESMTAYRAGWLARRLALPLLYDNHMVHVASNPSRSTDLLYKTVRTVRRLIPSSNAYRYLGVAKECCDFLIDAEGVPADRVECLPLGVDTSLFAPDDQAGSALRHDVGIPPSAWVVMQTGKLSPEKGADVLSAAMARAMVRRPDLWLVFVGSGPADFLRKVMDPLESAGVSDRVKKLPFVPISQLSAHYSAADVLVYPAATSLSCLEAAACARQVVMTDLPTSRWRSEKGVGVCYRTGDVDDLMQVILRCTDDRAAAMDRGRQAQIAVMEQFSYDSIARRSEEIMMGAIRHHGRSR